jgi:hypothetical protein
MNPNPDRNTSQTRFSNPGRNLGHTREIILLGILVTIMGYDNGGNLPGIL